MLKQFFVIGCIRSGTSFLCDMFHDFVPNVYNETGERNVQLRQNIINENFAFKFCEDFDNIVEIKQLFKDCKIVLIIRDLRDVLNSIYNPNKNSIPPRDFSAVLDDLCLTQQITSFEAGLLVLNTYYTNIINALNNNQQLIDDIIIYDDFVKNPLILKKLFDKYFPEKIKDLEYYKYKVLKTPNQQSFINWSEEQKNTFKNYNNKFLNNLLIKFNFEKNDNW